MVTTEAPTWNRRILCLDDETAILQQYRALLSPERDPQVQELLRRRKKRLAEDEDGSPPDFSGDVSYNLYLAGTGEDAIEVVKTEQASGRPIAVGFFDMKLPGGLDGLETIARIKAIDPNMICAVVTAYTDRTVQQIGRIFARQDDWVYFNKPFSEGELKQAASHLISTYNHRREKEYAEKCLMAKNEELARTLDELVSTRQQLVQSAKMAVMGQMTAALYHELKQPITAISMAIEYLDYSMQALNDASRPDDNRQLVLDSFATKYDILCTSVTKMRALLTQFQSFSRKSGGQLVTTDLNNVVRDSLLLVSEQLRCKKIDTVLELQPHLPPISADANQLQQVFVNIIINAVDAMEAQNKKQIVLRTVGAEDSKEVEALVTDSGPGVPEDVMEKIFEPFFTTKGDGKGTGLGLSIVSRIIDDHRGKIVVERPAEGGTRFRICFPVG